MRPRTAEPNLLFWVQLALLGYAVVVITTLSFAVRDSYTRGVRAGVKMGNEACAIRHADHTCCVEVSE